jgi:hypothetical protein
LKANFETSFSLHKLQGLKPVAFKRYGSTAVNVCSPTVRQMRRTR